MKNAIWKKGLVVGIILLIIGVSFSTSKQIIALQPEIVVGPYTQNVTNDSITIAWETNIPATNNSVEYGENTDYGCIEYGPSGGRHHEITIYPPFTSGHYKVVSDGIESNDFEFKLAGHCYSTQEFKCVIFGDSRGVWDRWRHATEVANAVNAEHPDFVIHGGDMVNDGRVQTQWDSWLGLMKSLMQNSTVFGILGNHEYNGSRYYEIFALPNNEMWYSFDYGPCHFTILDNYESWDVGSPQYEWLKDDLSSSMAPFKIVCFHEPIYCSGGHEPRTDVRAAWESLFNNYNVDLVFQSHNHYYQRTDPIKGITYIVSGGAGAPLYTPEDAWFMNNSKKAYHYCVLDVSLVEMRMTCSARYTNGIAFDEFVVCPPTTPSVKIIKPEKALYIFNKKIMPLSSTLIIGKIDIEVFATDYKSGIDRVEFYIDGGYKGNDTSLPYEWTWDETIFGKHTINAIAYDNSGNTASDEQEVWIFNL
ncbi:MAG: metallophosphoesterase [Candidatus Thermoplasmatota archaeon]|nr:metallophosphoesterase [Candidatus Thermoplasmatota archaeon]